VNSANASAQQQYQLHVELGIAYRTRGRRRRRAARVRRCRGDSAGFSVEVQRFRGLTLESSGRPAEAARVFHTAWSRDPVDPVTAYYVLRHDAFSPDEAARALQTLSQAYDGLRTTATPPATPPFEILDGLPDTLWPMPVVGDARTGPGFALLAAGKYTEAVDSLSSIGGAIRGPIDGPLAPFRPGTGGRKGEPHLGGTRGIRGVARRRTGGPQPDLRRVSGASRRWRAISRQRSTRSHRRFD
jgi:hypothetical protein